jgi:hypothetical protein
MESPQNHPIESQPEQLSATTSQSQRVAERSASLSELLVPTLRMLRRGLGWLLFGLGLLGLVFPILPGFLLLALSMILLGPKDPFLRRIAVSTRLALRHWSQMKHPHLRRIGQSLRNLYSGARRQFRAQFRLFEEHTSRRRAHVLILISSLSMLAIAIGITFLIWQQVA